MQLEMLFKPGMISKLEVKNRIVMPAIGNPLASQDGYVTPQMIDYYVERAKGGVGLIITQFCRVTPDSGPAHSMDIFDDKFIPGLRDLTAAVHAHGAKIATQPCHLGLIMLQTKHPEDMPIVVPTVLPWMAEKGGYKETSKSDIERYIDAFVEAARRAKEAGFDAVEFHACHGCLLNSFLSPALNRRTDEYGNSVENRVKIIREILTRTRRKVGTDYPLIVRISGDDDYEGGTRAADAGQQAKLLEEAGADGISVSAGLEFWSPLSMPCYVYPAGVLTPLAATVKKIVKVPVITAGKIDIALADHLIKDGKADFIAMGRPLLADPHLPNKAREGRLEDINHCLYCNNCLAYGRNRYRSCTVNPFLFREHLYPLKPAQTKKKVMVVGGGLAGMKAALLIAERGHDVFLYERENDLGGQWIVASTMKAKKSFASLTDQMSKNLLQSGVKIFTGKEVTKELVSEIKPDVVVLATGATPQIPNVPGVNGSNVVQANDVIMGQAKVGNKVVVLGGRFLGMDVAIELAEQGKEVALVTRSRIGGKKKRFERHTYKALLRRLIELRVPLYPDSPAIEITDKGVYVEHHEGVFLLKADTVVLCVGARSQSSLAAKLKGMVPELYQIGDCVEPEDARTATYEAATVAIQI